MPPPLWQGHNRLVSAPMFPSTFLLHQQSAQIAELKNNALKTRNNAQPTLKNAAILSLFLASSIVHLFKISHIFLPELHYYYTRLTASFSRTTWISRHQKGKTSLDLNEARYDGVLGHSGISWTTQKQSAPRSRQITTSTPHHSIFTGHMLFLTSNQQCQSTEGNSYQIFQPETNQNQLNKISEEV